MRPIESYAFAPAATPPLVGRSKTALRVFRVGVAACPWRGPDPHPKFPRDARKFRPPRKREVKSKRRCNMANLEIDPGRAPLSLWRRVLASPHPLLSRP